MTPCSTYRQRTPAAKWLLCLLACFLLPLSTPAAVILIIDISDPSQVTFTSTNANAQNDDEDSWLQEGISLIGFFQASVEDLYFFDTPSGLRSPGGSFAYSTLTGINFFDPLSPDTYQDLSIFGSGFSTQDFSTGARALSGSSTADLTDLLASLPPVGTTGNIYSGDGISFEGPVIGQYTVVPEPAAIGLLTCGGIFAFLRGRKRRQAA